MTVPRMHDEEVGVDDDLVRRLLAAQLPDLAGLPVTRIEAWGTDHAIFRLGDRHSVRLPKIGWAARQGEKEATWLPIMAPHLPVEVPVPHAVGEPGEGYPFPWYVAPWLDGTNPSPDGGTDGAAADRTTLAADLAAFVLALQAVGDVVDPATAPPLHRGQRGGPLEQADGSTRRRAADMRGEAGDAAVERLLVVWDAGLHAPAWDGPPRWFHGDLMDGNLLLRDGRLTGVIDWGSLATGDPAVDLVICWSFFDGPSRTAYRDALGFVDEDMWLRGRAWAVSAAIQALPYYRDTNPDIVARSWRAVRAALADLDDHGR